MIQTKQNLHPRKICTDVLTLVFDHFPPHYANVRGADMGRTWRLEDSLTQLLRSLKVAAMDMAGPNKRLRDPRNAHVPFTTAEKYR